MLDVNYKHQMGEVSITQKQGEKFFDFTIGIYECNALAAFIHTAVDKEGKREYANLYSFLADKQHAENILRSKSDFFGVDKVNSIQLNMAYKGCADLLKLFTRQGHEVTCYYSKPS